MIKKIYLLIPALIASVWLAVLSAQSSPPSSAAEQAGQHKDSNFLTPGAPNPIGIEATHTPTFTPTPTATTTGTTTTTPTATTTGTATTTPTATLTGTIVASPTLPSLYLPVLHGMGVWKQMDGSAVQTGALSLAVCPTQPTIRYLGAAGGLFKWSVNGWDQVMQTEDPTPTPIPGAVWDVWLEGNNCDEVYAAALEDGLWRVAEGEAKRIDEEEDEIPPVASVVIRSQLLFAGTDGGVRLYDLDQKKWLKKSETSPNQLITRQSMAGERIYVGAWTFGVKYNDACGQNQSQCQWVELPAPPNLVYVRDVLGSPAGEPDEANFWAVAATSAGVAYWNGEEWTQPAEDDGPQPNGDTFALAQSTDGTTIFAAVEGSGIWASADKGKSWNRLGEFNLLTRDLTVSGNTLYAVTPNDGVWQWLLQGATQ